MQLAFYFDQTRCTGCHTCVVACKDWHDLPAELVKWRWVKTYEEGTFPDVRVSHVSSSCNHCEKPACAEACPEEAICKRDSDGVVLIDAAKCTGCRICEDACPYGAISFNDEKDKAEKCNLCSHRIEGGVEPFCVICCEGQAIHFGDLSDPDSGVSKILKSNENFRLKPDAGTGPAVYYLPPKIPRGL